MKEKINYILNSLEGVHSAMKMLHWSTTNKSEHLLTDEIDGSVLEYEDKIAEAAMGVLDDRFGIGDLKTLLPEHKDVKGILSELQKDVLDLENKLSDAKYNGIVNILDDLLTDINKWNYLRTLK